MKHANKSDTTTTILGRMMKRGRPSKLAKTNPDVFKIAVKVRPSILLMEKLIRDELGADTSLFCTGLFAEYAEAVLRRWPEGKDDYNLDRGEMAKQTIRMWLPKSQKGIVEQVHYTGGRCLQGIAKRFLLDLANARGIQLSLSPHNSVPEFMRMTPIPVDLRGSLEGSLSSCSDDDDDEDHDAAVMTLLGFSSLSSGGEESPSATTGNHHLLEYAVGQLKQAEDRLKLLNHSDLTEVEQEVRSARESLQILIGLQT